MSEQAKDTRINLSTVNTETVQRICSATKENHKTLIERLLHAEENRLKMEELSQDDTEYLSKISRLFNSFFDISTSYIRLKDVSKEELTANYNKEIEQLKKTIESLTDKDITANKLISQKDSEISELKDKIDLLNKELARTQEENKIMKNYDDSFKEILMLLHDQKSVPVDKQL